MSHISEVATIARHPTGSHPRPQDDKFESRRFFYIISIPIMFIFGFYALIKKKVWKKLFGKEPDINVWFFDGISINSRRVKEGQARWGALAAVYNFKKGEGSNFLVRAIDDWWLHVLNAQAVRNRLKIVKSSLREAIRHQNLRKSGNVRVLSLAAGSAQAVLEVAEELRQEGIIVELLLIDLDRTAIAEMNKRIAELSMQDSVTVQRGNVERVNIHAEKFRPDIIEMCGYMDYFSVERMIQLTKEIKNSLPQGGHFLTCHIHPNHESFFLEHVANWKMWYKPLSDLETIMYDGGFQNTNYKTEPLKIHTVAIAQK